MIKKNFKQGFAIFFAVMLTGIVFAVAYAVSFSARSELVSVRGDIDSKKAYSAAENGMDCALFWELSDPTGNFDTFATTTPTQFKCNGIEKTKPETPGDSYTFSFRLWSPKIDPETCSLISVTKTKESDDSISTTIESRGYNSCAQNTTSEYEPTTSSLERAVKVQY